MYFLQVLAKPCRTPLITEDLSLNASSFSYARTQKTQFFGKIDSKKKKKIQKSFIVYNNNNNLQVHNKSDHWRNKQNNIESLSLNIVPCFAIKQLKCTCNKGVLSIQIISKCIFALFREFFDFKWRPKLLTFLNFVLPNSCVMLLTILKHVVQIQALLNILILG